MSVLLPHGNEASWNFGGHQPPENLDELQPDYAIIDGVKVDPKDLSWRDIADNAMRAAARRYGFPIIMSKLGYLNAVVEVVLRPTDGVIDIRCASYSAQTDTKTLSDMVHWYCHEAGVDYYVPFSWGDGKQGTYSSKGALAFLPTIDA